MLLNGSTILIVFWCGNVGTRGYPKWLWNLAQESESILDALLGVYQAVSNVTKKNCVLTARNLKTLTTVSEAVGDLSLPLGFSHCR